MDNELARNLRNVWLVGGSGHPLLFLALMQLTDLMLTLLHSLQELKGKLWKYFGDIAGVRISDSFGHIFFFGGLTVGLWLVGLLAIGGAGLWPQELTFGSLGMLIGCRVSDGVFSHILPFVMGYRPNPALTSVPFYFAEALFLLLAFREGLGTYAVWTIFGFSLGVFAFALIIPLLGLVGPRAPGIRSWRPGEPQPD